MSFLDNLERFGRNNLSTGGDVSSLDSYDPTQPVGPQNDFSRDFYAGQGSGNELPESMRVIDPTADVNNLHPEDRLTGDVIKIGSKHAQLVLDKAANAVNASQVALTANSPSKILPLRPHRTAVTLYNTSTTDTVYIGATSGEASIYSGFPIMPGASLTLNVVCELWAVSTVNLTVACLESMYA